METISSYSTSSMLRFIRDFMPSLWLKTNRPWAEMQNEAKSAAVLTHSVNFDGFFTGYPNTQRKCLAKAVRPSPAVAKLPCDATTLEDLDADFFNRVDAKDLVSYPPDGFSSQLLELSPWKSGSDLAIVLNHNLVLLRQSLSSIDSLPSPRDMSLELLYGLVLARWPAEGRNISEIRNLATKVPFLTASSVRLHVKDAAPSERKVGRLVDAMLTPIETNSTNWRTKLSSVIDGVDDILERGDVEEVKDLLRRAIAASLASRKKGQCKQEDSDGVSTNQVACIGASVRKKLAYILRYIESLEIERDGIWRVQSDVKLMKTGISDDYRSSGDIDIALYQGLEQALRNLPTDIQVSNMSTLRNPKKHFLHSFLYGKIASKLTNSGSKEVIKHQLQLEMKKLAKLSNDLKGLEMYKSDWKNNIASMWSERRRKLLEDYKRSVGRFEFAPAQWDIAIDLYPQAHPFAFTYGRSGGYALVDHYNESLEWLLRHANSEEKAYFIYLVSLDEYPAQLSYLDVLPIGIKTEANKVAKAIINYDTRHGDDASINRVIKMIDEWCHCKESAETAIDTACRDFVSKKKHQLPGRLKDRLPPTKELYYRNVVTLFDLALSTYDGPVVLLSQSNS